MKLKPCPSCEDLLEAGEALFRSSCEEYKNCENRGGFYDLACALDDWRMAVKQYKKRAITKLCEEK
jgi:hypothetical protein